VVAQYKVGTRPVKKLASLMHSHKTKKNLNQIVEERLTTCVLYMLFAPCQLQQMKKNKKKTGSFFDNGD
jgi:hypothetical protein